MNIIEQSLVSWVPRRTATINWMFYPSFSRDLLRKNLGSSSAGIELCWCWYWGARPADIPHHDTENWGGLCRSISLTVAMCVLFSSYCTCIALTQILIYLTNATNACGLHLNLNLSADWCQFRSFGPIARQNLVHNCTIFLCSLDVRNIFII